MMKNVYSVGQVNAYIKNMFAQDFMMQRICIKGEVSNCKYHTSGHIYFTLKDKTGTMSAIMFAGNRRGLNFWASLVAQLVKNLPAMWEIWVQSLSWEDLLEKEKATHSSILAWRIPWTV